MHSLKRKISGDAFVQVADDADPAMADADIAARFLDDARAFAACGGNRRDLANNRDDYLCSGARPWSPRFPASARPPYSQARCCGTLWFSGELRATPGAARPVRVMLAAGFRRVRVKKQSDGGVCQHAKRYRVLSADRRWPITALHRRMQLRHSESAGQMNLLHIRRNLNDRAGFAFGRGARCALRNASPAEVILRLSRPSAASISHWFIVRHRICCAAQGDGRRRPRYPVSFSTPDGCSRRRLPIATPLIATLGCATSFDQTARGGASREDPDRELWSPIPMPAARIRSGASQAGTGAVQCLDQRAQTLSGGLRAAIPVVEDDASD